MKKNLFVLDVMFWVKLVTSCKPLSSNVIFLGSRYVEFTNLGVVVAFRETKCQYDMAQCFSLSEGARDFGC